MGADKDGGLVRTLKVTASNVHAAFELLTGSEETVCGDSGYPGTEKREDAVARNWQGGKIKYRINRRLLQIKKLSKSGQYAARRAEYKKSSVYAKTEHVFGEVKGFFRYRKTRYRGLQKQTDKLNMLFALANLILADRPCLCRLDSVCRCRLNGAVSVLTIIANAQLSPFFPVVWYCLRE